MNLTQLSAFRAVMTSASLSDAARKLGRTQPAVSLAIRSLEDTLGMKLFERRGRQLVPVPEAQYLLVEAERVLDRLNTVSRTMKSLAAGVRGPCASRPCRGRRPSCFRASSPIGWATAGSLM